MAEQAARKQVCSKETFLKVFANALKNEGVVVLKNGKKSQSKDEFWELYRKIKNLEIAITAAAGAQVSLSGVGVFRFAEAGRTEESRSMRFKSKVSSSVAKAFREHPELISSEAVTDEATLNAKVADVMSYLGTPLVEAGPQVIEASGDTGTTSANDLV